jgi:hypothetical protein
MSTASPLALASAPGPADVPAAQPASLTVSKMQAHTTFGTPHGLCSISGTISGMPDTFSPAGQTFTINIMGAAGSFTLDAKGHGKSSQGSVALKVNSNSTLLFSAKLNGDLAGTWSLQPSSVAQTSKMDLWASVELAGCECATPLSVTCTVSKGGVKLKQ